MPADPLYWTDEALDLSFANKVSSDPLGLYTCIQCGSCTASCPTANHMSISPQTISRLVRLGLWQEALASGAFWRCTSCDACTAHCPRGISTLDTIIGLKRYAVQTGCDIPEDVELLRQTIRSSHNVSGDPNEERLGWSTNLPQPLTDIEGRTDCDMLYFVGCISSFYPRAFSIPQAFGRTLHQAGIKFTTLGGDEWCCGYPLHNAGLGDEMKNLVRHNVEAVKRSGATTLVTTCPSCHYVWKVLYPRITDLPIDLKIVHSTEIIADLLDSQRIRPGMLSRVVTYHDPCDLGRKCGEYDTPRHILKILPGIEFREMANIRENALCCGGGGDVKIFSHSATADVARRRLQQAIDIGADTIVSSCQQCKRALVSAVQKMRQPIKVYDMAEIIWETLLNKVRW